MALVSIVVIMLFTVIMIKSTDLKEKKAAYDEKEATLEQQIENENERTQELIEYEKYTKTAKYVEEVAKEKLGLVYEDEIIFESEDGN